jgi:hypothetical protein
VRRITDKSLGTFFADEVAAPLGLSAWIGLPEEQEENVARIEHAPFNIEELSAGMIEATGLDADTVAAWIGTMFAPDSAAARAAALGGAFDPSSDHFSTRAYRAAEFPCCNMLTDARSVARMYAATVSEVDLTPGNWSICCESHDRPNGQGGGSREGQEAYAGAGGSEASGG